MRPDGRRGLGVAHADVHVGVHGARARGPTRCGLAGPDLVDAPRHRGRGQVVQQHPVGPFAGQAQHPLVQRAEHHLGPTVSQADAQSELGAAVELAVEADGVATQARRGQLQELPCLRHRSVAVRGTVPASDHDGRRDADAQQHVVVRSERLQGGGAHGSDHRSPQLQRQHTGAQVQSRDRRGHRPERGERLGPDRLGRPERRTPPITREAGHLQTDVQSQRLEARERQSDRWSAVVVGRMPGHGRRT